MSSDFQVGSYVESETFPGYLFEIERIHPQLFNNIEVCDLGLVWPELTERDNTAHNLRETLQRNYGVAPTLTRQLRQPQNEMLVLAVASSNGPNRHITCEAYKHNQESDFCERRIYIKYFSLDGFRIAENSGWRRFPNLSQVAWYCPECKSQRST